MELSIPMTLLLTGLLCLPVIILLTMATQDTVDLGDLVACFIAAAIPLINAACIVWLTCVYAQRLIKNKWNIRWNTVVWRRKKENS